MMSILKVVVYTISMYIYLILIIRLMGKREIGQLGVIDLIISILMAEMVAISIENIDKSKLNSLVFVTQFSH